jgi:T5SS/PEP-CTERM-associated repeat protein
MVGGEGANWTSSGVIEVGRSGEATLSINAGGHVTSAGGVIARNATAPLSSVTVTGAGAAWTVNGDLHVGGSAAGSGGQATLELLPEGQVSVTGTLHNWPNGMVSLNGGTLSATSVQHDGNGGNLLIHGGTLNADSILAPSGFTMFDGAINAGSITAANTFIAGGTLHVFTVNGDLDNNGATLSPGMSAGTATINGDLTQNSPGTLLIELGSASNFDKLAITGTLAPHGSTLEVQLMGGYSPAAGASFDILDWGAIDLFGGEFTLQLPTLAAGRTWNTSQLYSTGVLSVVGGEVLPGDYNSDNMVDTADYIVWRKNVGTNNTLANDPIGGTIGQEHYNQWVSHFGQSLGVASGPGFQAATPLAPEPASAALLLGCALLLGGRFRR